LHYKFSASHPQVAITTLAYVHLSRYTLINVDFW